MCLWIPPYSGATSRTTLWPGSEIYILFDLAHDLVRLCCPCQSARIEFDIFSAELAVLRNVAHVPGL